MRLTQDELYEAGRNRSVGSSRCTFSGMDRVAALRLARELGCTVEPIPGTGEVRVKHATIARTLRLNNRRRDAARVLTTLLRKLAKTPRTATATAGSPRPPA